MEGSNSPKRRLIPFAVASNFMAIFTRGNGARELTKQQYTLLAALEHNDGASQTVLVEITGIDRSTLAEMVRRMLEKACCRGSGPRKTSAPMPW